MPEKIRLIIEEKEKTMNQQESKFKANWKIQECDECGQIPQDQVFIPVWWGIGRTGVAGVACCGSKFHDEVDVSEDGMVYAHCIRD